MRGYLGLLGSHISTLVAFVRSRLRALPLETGVGLSQLLWLRRPCEPPGVAHQDTMFSQTAPASLTAVSIAPAAPGGEEPPEFTVSTEITHHVDHVSDQASRMDDLAAALDRADSTSGTALAMELLQMAGVIPDGYGSTELYSWVPLQDDSCRRAPEMV